MGIVVGVVSFLVSFLTVPLVILLANKRGAVSLPGRRHIHKRPTPKLGGISIALGVFSAMLFVLPLDRVVISYLISSALMLSLGIIDDHKEIKWKTKLAMSLVAISIMIFGGDVYIRNIGNLFGQGVIELGPWAIPFTYFAVFGVINAINLIDGLNGLACGVSVIAFAAFALFGYMDGNNTAFYLGLASLFSALGLFRYNYPKAKLFIGDSGSLFIGFTLSVLAILLTQGGGKTDPMVPVVVLAIPIFDTVRVMILRAFNRKHPFRADKTHMHHLMMRSGISLTKVVKLIWLMSVTMAVLAFAFRKSESWHLLLVLVPVVVGLSFLIENLRIIRAKKTRAYDRSSAFPARLRG